MRIGNPSFTLSEFPFWAEPISNYEEINNIDQWCVEHMGHRGIRWEWGDDKYWFKDQKDQVLFVLKWG